MKKLENYKNLLTILVPLYKRPGLTLRLLKNLKEQNCPFRILLADGAGIRWDHKKYVHEFKEQLNIEYVDFGSDNNYADYLKKMYSASSMVETKYVITIDNDDF